MVTLSFEINGRSLRYQGSTTGQEIIKFHDLLAPVLGCLEESTFYVHEQQFLALIDNHGRKNLPQQFIKMLKNKKEPNSAFFITQVFSYLFFFTFKAATIFPDVQEKNLTQKCVFVAAIQVCCLYSAPPFHRIFQFSLLSIWGTVWHLFLYSLYLSLLFAQFIPWSNINSF